MLFMSGEMPFDPSIAGIKPTQHDAKDAKKEYPDVR